MKPIFNKKFIDFMVEVEPECDWLHCKITFTNTFPMNVIYLELSPNTEIHNFFTFTLVLIEDLHLFLNKKIWQ